MQLLVFWLFLVDLLTYNLILPAIAFRLSLQSLSSMTIRDGRTSISPLYHGNSLITIVEDLLGYLESMPT